MIDVPQNRQYHQNEETLRCEDSPGHPKEGKVELSGLLDGPGVEEELQQDEEAWMEVGLQLMVRYRTGPSITTDASHW